MNTPTKQKQIHRQNRLVTAMGEGWIGNLRLAYANY